jgi:hypothetical protein
MRMIFRGDFSRKKNVTRVGLAASVVFANRVVERDATFFREPVRRDVHAKYLP